MLDQATIGRPADAAHAGDDISILGFPHVLPGTLGAFPVLRAGRVAPYLPGAAPDRDRLLINTSAFAGDSGGPVFATGRSRNPRLVGILSERIGQKEAAVPLAIALSANVVRETVEMQAEEDRFEVQVGTPEVILSAPRPHRGGVQLAGPPQRFLQRTFSNLPRL